jgi:hypothetical protein
VYVGLNRLRTHEGFAQADQPLVGVNTYPNDVGKLAQPERFNLCDFQSALQKKRRPIQPAVCDE